MKIALLLTGQARSLPSIHAGIYKNLIQPNQADVFVHCSPYSYDTKLEMKETTFQEYWGDCVKAVRFWDETDGVELQQVRQEIEKTRPFIARLAASSWGDYWRHSGTLIEYVEINKTFQMMREYEEKHGVRYDYILRSRLDLLPTTPFRILQLQTGDLTLVEEMRLSARSASASASATTPEAVSTSSPTESLASIAESTSSPTESLASIAESTSSPTESLASIAESTLTPAEFISTPALIPTEDETLFLTKLIKSAGVKQIFDKNNTDPSVDEFVATKVKEFIATKEHKYTQEDLSGLVASIPLVNTLRCNMFFCGPRAPMIQLCELIHHYGEYDKGQFYDWNSESQFQYHARANKINLVDYHSHLEEDYLVTQSLNRAVLIQQEGETSTSVAKELVYTVVRPRNCPGGCFQR